MSKEFRIHDFFLGRFNCEIFLRNYFTVSEHALKANPIFQKGYKGIDKKMFESKKKPGHYQVIPIFSPNPPENVLPLPTFSCGKNWPIITEEAVEKFRNPVKKRVQLMLLNAVKLKGINKFLVWIGAKVVLNRVMTNAAMKSIKKALAEHRLLKLKDE